MELKKRLTVQCLNPGVRNRLVITYEYLSQVDRVAYSSYKKYENCKHHGRREETGEKKFSALSIPSTEFKKS